MPFEATVFNVLIASPGDVQAERNIIREECQVWNAVHSKSREIVLNPVGWDTHSHPEMGDRPQGVINKQLVDDADLVVAVFWTRIGTPTGEAPGGSVEELSRHMNAGKPAMVYFSSQAVEPDKADTQQYRDLKNFRDTWCRPRGLVEGYKTTEEFRNLFARHIAQKVNDDLYLQKHIKTNAGLMPVHVFTPPERKLGAEAKVVLLAAALDTNGTIIAVNTVASGYQVMTNKTSLVKDRSPRSQAAWQAAIEELLRDKLIAPSAAKPNSLYKLTATGYALADQLNA